MLSLVLLGAAFFCLNVIWLYEMDAEIVALAADLGHFPSLIDLGRTYYPADHPVLTFEFLRWSYLDNPAGPATLIVAQEGKLWIGVIVLIPVMLVHRKQLQKACYAVNVLTHPRHRGKNLFVKMISYAKSYLSKSNVWLIGHPNASAVPGWKRQKMEFREPLVPHLAKFRMPFSSISVRPVSSLDDLRSIPSEFWESITCRSDVHVHYTPEFIAWRFLQAPAKKYQVSIVRRRAEVIGLRVTRRFKGPIDLMVDLIARPGLIGPVVSSVVAPTLVIHSSLGSASGEVKQSSWKLPINRQFPFFVTAWGQERDSDMTGITLAASDF